MKTREGADVSVHRHSDVVVVVTKDDPNGSAEQDAPAPRRALAVVLLGILGLAIVVTLALVWVSAGDDSVTAPSPGQPAAKPGEPAALSVSVQAPASVVAGTPATFVLSWEDGAGTFAGTTEDWGDGVGVGSVALGQCTASDLTGPGSGSVRLTHTWSEPGTYPVVLAATTTTCRDGQPVTEDASRTLEVTVTPR